jgi:hypothetical protein
MTSELRVAAKVAWGKKESRKEREREKILSLDQHFFSRGI